MGKLVKSNVMKATSSPSKLLKVDMHLSENTIEVTQFDVGFAMKNVLHKTPKLLDLTILEIKRDCLSFAIKIVERTPLKFKLI